MGDNKFSDLDTCKLSESMEATIKKSILYAITANIDGTVDLTVFEAGGASTIELSQALLKQMIGGLSLHVQSDQTPDESLVNTDNLDDLGSACTDLYRGIADKMPVDGKDLMLEVDAMRPEDPILLYKALLNYDGPDMMPGWRVDKQKELTESLNKLRYSLLGKVIDDGNVTEINRPVNTWGVDIQKGGLKVLGKIMERSQ